MSYDEVADKFRECAAYSRWPKTKAEQVVEMVRHLEEVRHVRELTALLSRDAGGAAGKGRVAARVTRPVKASPRKPPRKATNAKAKKRAR
jgi:hypothetical protein